MLAQHRNHVLDTLQVLVNSCPPAIVEEELPDLSSIKRFVKNRIITEVAELTSFDVGQLHMVRSQFRAIFVAPDDITKITLVNNALSSARISPRPHSREKKEDQRIFQMPPSWLQKLPGKERIHLNGKARLQH